MGRLATLFLMTLSLSIFPLMAQENGLEYPYLQDVLLRHKHKKHKKHCSSKCKQVCPAGPQGATGPSGPAGPAGAIGLTGPIGPQGAPGTTLAGFQAKIVSFGPVPSPSSGPILFLGSTTTSFGSSIALTMTTLPDDTFSLSAPGFYNVQFIGALDTSSAATPISINFTPFGSPTQTIPGSTVNAGSAIISEALVSVPLGGATIQFFNDAGTVFTAGTAYSVTIFQLTSTP